jgi:hypothetical protein
MKPDIKQRWLAALRSGNYEQGKGSLSKIDKKGNVSYCCLGVLCDILKDESKLFKQTYKIKAGNYEYSVYGIEYVDECETLPYSQMEYVGISDADTNILIEMNDDDVNEKTFNEIADYIEDHL